MPEKHYHNRRKTDCPVSDNRRYSRKFLRYPKQTVLWGPCDGSRIVCITIVTHYGYCLDSCCCQVRSCRQILQGEVRTYCFGTNVPRCCFRISYGKCRLITIINNTGNPEIPNRLPSFFGKGAISISTLPFLFKSVATFHNAPSDETYALSPFVAYSFRRKK